MSIKGIDKTIKNIKEQKIGNTQKKVLLVEGSDDVSSLDLLLPKVAEQWGEKWVLAEAGNKSAVLEIIKREPSWLGLVDRDEWGDDKISQLEQEQNNICFLPRYCIENYLIVPSELWQALPDKQKAKIDGGYDQFNASLLNDLAKWVKHGVLWSVVNPLWEGLRSLGFKEALLRADIAGDETEIKKILGEWHEFLNPDQIWSRYQTKLQEVEAKPSDDQLKFYVHGKQFYEQVVNTVLNRLLGQKSAQDRQFSIIRTLPAIDDLNVIWNKMTSHVGVD